VALGPKTRRLTSEEYGKPATVAWVVAKGEVWRGPHEDGTALPIAGLPLRGAYDLVTAVEQLLGPDCESVCAQGGPGERVPDASIVIGDPTAIRCRGAAVEPGVVFDVHRGPVILEEGVFVRSGARLEGPLYVGRGTQVFGGQIRHSVIGPQSRVHGEMTTTVLLGYANKSHDGFVGHSVLGHWVNLGAGTTTSNLKNTYGEVRLDLPGGRVETGRTNLGSLIGDHAKTAIGTLLSTGTVIGAGANVVGAPVPRYVAPFSWGVVGGEWLGVEGFVKIATRVMPRRGVAVDARLEAALRALHARQWGAPSVAPG
jgi:UDP-N-acetylglucosamine diphosphorylase/glucosamine-1-phosphate N-acetyltransferase